MKTRSEKYEQLSLFDNEPQEPSIEEQIELATKEYQDQIMDLSMKLASLESENSYLKHQLEEQEQRHLIELGKAVRKYI